MGPGSYIVIAAAALLLFGPKKLPEIGKALGRTLHELKLGAKGFLADEEDNQQSEAKHSEPMQGDLRDPLSPRMEYYEPVKKPQDPRRLPE